MELVMEFVDVRRGELDAQGIAVLISLKKISRVLHQAILYLLPSIKQHFIKRIIPNRLLLTPLVHACSWHHDKSHTSRSRGAICMDSVAISLNVYVE
jgi:hypothetical protein